VADPGVGTRGGSIDLLTALDLLGKAEESRDTWRQTAFASAVKLQERVAELETERAGYATILHDVLLSAPADVQRAGLERIAALAAVRQEKP
jgi:hypothetical protein